MSFRHRLQQRGLGFGGGAIDLIGQYDVVKDCSGMKQKGVLGWIVDLYPDDIGRQQVGGELNAAEIAMQAVS